MVKGKKRAGKRTSPPVGFGCDEVEQYLDRAIEEVKKEILPKITAIDQRDKEQYENARDYLTKSFESLVERNAKVEHTITHVGKELEEIYEDRKKMVAELTDMFHNLTGVLHKHITDETAEFKEISVRQEAMKDTITTVQDTLNTVSANGNKGLHASLKDLYNKNNEVHTEIVGLKDDIKSFRDLVQPELDRKAWWISTKKMMKTSALFKMLTTKGGIVIFIFIGWLLANIILHPFGINLGLATLLNLLGYAVGPQ
jgi:hypothetical protein